MSTDQLVKDNMRQFVQGALKPWYWRLWMKMRGIRRVKRIGNYEFTVYTNKDLTFVATCDTFQ